MSMFLVDDTHLRYEFFVSFEPYIFLREKITIRTTELRIKLENFLF